MTTVTVISRNNKHPFTFCLHCTTNVALTMTIVDAASISSEIPIKRLNEPHCCKLTTPSAADSPSPPKSTTFSTIIKLFFLTYINRLINILETAVRL